MPTHCQLLPFAQRIGRLADYFPSKKPRTFANQTRTSPLARSISTKASTLVNRLQRWTLSKVMSTLQLSIGFNRSSSPLRVALLSLVLLSSNSPAQVAPPVPSERNDTTQGLRSSEIAELQRDTLSLKVETAKIASRLDSSIDYFNIVLTVLAIFIAVGTASSLYVSFQAERREKKSFENTVKAEEGAAMRTQEHEERARTAFKVMLRGEEAAQSRATATHDQFFESSGKTLGLVNDTLTLAKEASERAAKAVLARAEQMLKDLTAHSRQLLERASGEEDRFLVSDLDMRSDLRSLARKINGFESSRLFLPEEIPMTPECLFIRGMDFHLDQAIPDAIDAWEQVAMDEDSPKALQSQAWYWIGYERNNIGNFKEAERAFKNALEGAEGNRRYELQRIRIESQFFQQTDNSSLKPIIRKLEELLEKCRSDTGDIDIKMREAVILRNLGNVASQALLDARTTGSTAEQQTLCELAERAFSDALEIVKGDKWSMFGLAEILKFRSEEGRAKALLSDVRGLVEKESIDRAEPRTKVLCRSTELICCVEVEQLHPLARVSYNYLVGELGRVDGRMTVYSQWRKRNIKKAVFQEELNEFAKRHASLILGASE